MRSRLKAEITEDWTLRSTGRFETPVQLGPSRRRLPYLL